ncbi:hypothetical protein U3516DRAFT_494094, partial [Neocallimastix sp. 'constans']
INKKNCSGEYPLLEAINNNSLKIINLLTIFENDCNYTMQVNQTDNNGNYQLLKADQNTVKRDIIELVNYLFAYTNCKNIFLNINEEDPYKIYPL